MSKKNKNRLTLKPEGLAWLAQNTNPDQWQRVLSLHDRNIPALFAYIKSTATDETYKKFEELNLPPEIVAERRRAEAAKIEAEMQEARTIGSGFKDIPPPSSLAAVMGGCTWKPLILTKDKEAIEEAQRRVDFENFELSIIPEPIL